MTPWKIVETAEGGDMNEELRRQIEARRDEELATIASVAAGAFGSSAAKRQYRAKHKATADALEWVLDLLDAQPAAVSLPEEAEPITVERLAAVIREVDGNHSLGAGALAEAILAALAPSPLPVVTAERQEALLTMLDGCEEAARIYEEQIAAIEANERAVDRWIAGAPAVSLELPEPPRRTPNREPQPSDGPDFWADHAAWKAQQSTEPPIEDAGSGGVW